MAEVAAKDETAMRPLVLLSLAGALLLAACATPQSSYDAAQNLGSTQHRPAD